MIYVGDIGLHGAGSQIPSQAYREAGAVYAAKRQSLGRNVIFDYDSVNGGYGKQRMISQANGVGNESPLISFGGTESLLTKKEQQENPDLRLLPMFAG